MTSKASGDFYHSTGEMRGPVEAAGARGKRLQDKAADLFNKQFEHRVRREKARLEKKEAPDLVLKPRWGNGTDALYNQAMRNVLDRHHQRKATIARATRNAQAKAMGKEFSRSADGRGRR